MAELVLGCVWGLVLTSVLDVLGLVAIITALLLVVLLVVMVVRLLVGVFAIRLVRVVGEIVQRHAAEGAAVPVMVVLAVTIIVVGHVAEDVALIAKAAAEMVAGVTVAVRIFSLLEFVVAAVDYVKIVPVGVQVDVYLLAQQAVVMCA